ncbi:50S ribosomal protein L3 [Rubrivirga sp. SAORIC476]|uniref:50S ribosomal protein L3 n=1 Tax=Rubrivirga sp. SAORIC476 TaxID=1961794 RepID=UPI000BA94BC8|nr:50S ribosomal protein L3 [Rubrivirga sp. SAORIC476]MAQ95745.1 50S ribosomal protein L3 [Rhodothermaceae bacterium]MBC12048.1 50S ribosomal protein L3 [Rhodothermaceae bacterium]MBC12663.1 50S ribosomal protein L3 [Rhodothermaceae bacterium]PAP74940.1 50S ribosomal protein L3 [Rubrivirga sp. SAORIC476]
MSALLGRKVGMTSVFDESGRQTVVTVIEAGPCAVTQVKTPETDGYSAIQLGFQDKKESRTTKALQGHFEAAGVSPKKHVVEFRDSGLDVSLGDEITVDVFAEGDRVQISGVSKGKGFQGVVKRHNFKGVGDATHGQHNRQRAPGSIGQASDPSRVFKGTKMAGRTGGERVTQSNIRVVRTFPDNNLILVKGAVPGHKNGIVEIRRA